MQHVKVLVNSPFNLDLVREYCATYDFYGNFIAVYFESASAKTEFLTILMKNRFLQERKAKKVKILVLQHNGLSEISDKFNT